MTEAEIVEKVQETIAKLAPNQDVTVTADHLLLEDLEYHSLALLELAVELEEMFNLPPLDETTASEVSNVGDVCKLVAGLVAAQEGRGLGINAVPVAAQPR